jgi:polyhydroxyalkanoate synthesis regulator phasin
MTGILNGYSGNGAANGSEHGRDASDAQMEQIRDLLFGSVRDELMARFQALERRVTDLEHGLAAARRADESERRAAFDLLARGVSDLGSQIQRIAKP